MHTPYPDLLQSRPLSVQAQSQLMLWSLQTKALLRVIRVKRVPFAVLFVTLAVVCGVAVLTGVWAAVTSDGAIHGFVVSL